MKKIIITVLLVALIPVGLFAYNRGSMHYRDYRGYQDSRGYDNPNYDSYGDYDYYDHCQGGRRGGMMGRRGGMMDRYYDYRGESQSERQNPRLWTFNGDQWFYDGEAVPADELTPMHRWFWSDAPQSAPETQESAPQEEEILYVFPAVEGQVIYPI